MYSKLVSMSKDEVDIETIGESTVKIERGIYNRLKLIVKKKDKDVKNTLNKMVKNYVTKEELFEIYSPLLYIVTKKDSSIFIKDEKEGKLVEVILQYQDRDGNEDTIIIYCENCKSEYCVHTAFAMGSSELGELQIRDKKC